MDVYIVRTTASANDLLLLHIDEEDDEISATRYIASREALTLVRPIRQAGR